MILRGHAAPLQLGVHWPEAQPCGSGSMPYQGSPPMALRVYILTQAEPAQPVALAPIWQVSTVSSQLRLSTGLMT